MLNLSNFYKLKKPTLESYKRRAVVSAGASPLMRERRNTASQMHCSQIRLQ